MAKISTNGPGVCGLALEPGYPYGTQPVPTANKPVKPNNKSMNEESKEEFSPCYEEEMSNPHTESQEEFVLIH